MYLFSKKSQHSNTIFQGESRFPAILADFYFIEASFKICSNQLLYLINHFSVEKKIYSVQMEYLCKIKNIEGSPFNRILFFIFHFLKFINKDNYNQ